MWVNILFSTEFLKGCPPPCYSLRVCTMREKKLDSIPSWSLGGKIYITFNLNFAWSTRNHVHVCTMYRYRHFVSNMNNIINLPSSTFDSSQTISTYNAMKTFYCLLWKQILVDQVEIFWMEMSIFVVISGLSFQWIFSNYLKFLKYTTDYENYDKIVYICAAE